MGDETPRPVSVSREELFRQVWEAPMSQLGEAYGISGNGLAKICVRLSIPYPPRGYWAKKAAGKEVPHPSLPLSKPGAPTSATIKPKAKPAPLAPELQELGAIVARDRAIVVPTRLIRPHPIIAAWLAEHDRLRREAKNNRSLWGPTFTEWTETDHRRHRILDALFKAAARYGLKAEVGERRELYFMFGRERVNFKFRERLKQVRRPKTEKELRYSFSGDSGWTRELEPTGTLIFTIENYLGDSGIRREWLEGPQTPMEAYLQLIVSSLAMAGAALAKLRLEREDEERRRLDRERLRQIEVERHKKENNQWRRLVEIAKTWEEAELARCFLDDLESQSYSPTQIIGGRTIAEWIVWARDHTIKRNPLNGGKEAVFEGLAAVTPWTYRD